MNQQVCWIAVSEPPDDDTIVMVAIPDESETVWLGYLDSDGWYSIEGSRIRPTHWAELPEPPREGTS